MTRNQAVGVLISPLRFPARRYSRHCSNTITVVRFHFTTGIIIISIYDTNLPIRRYHRFGRSTLNASSSDQFTHLIEFIHSVEITHLFRNGFSSSPRVSRNFRRSRSPDRVLMVYPPRDGKRGRVIYNLLGGHVCMQRSRAERMIVEPVLFLLSEIQFRTVLPPSIAFDSIVSVFFHSSFHFAGTSLYIHWLYK